MARLGPFGPEPRLAVAVSGGADSTALALLAHDWAGDAGGSLIALIADHGLRSESAAEATLTASRLAALGIGSRILPLNLAQGPALQERARVARHAALAQAARQAGALHLLLGHHAGDQAELLAMRAVRGRRGAAGMAGFASRHDVVLLRPLLGIGPDELRVELRARGVAWVEDPSNTNPRFERARVRASHPDPTRPDPEAVGALAAAQRETAGFLAGHATIAPGGFAILRADRAPEDALAALLRVIGGAVYPPRRDGIARLAAGLCAATLGGVRIMAAGRLGPGWLMIREASACAGPVAPVPGAVWDGRFRILSTPGGADALGALGTRAAAFRRESRLPSAILRTLPAFFRAGEVLAVPHLGFGPPARLAFAPPGPAADLPFVSA
ncbi:MAG TPA: tRNA lysidine(34) synthetase TilS [Acidiphilium sp.]